MPAAAGPAWQSVAGGQSVYWRASPGGLVQAGSLVGKTSRSKLIPLRHGQIAVDDLAALRDPGGEPHVPQPRRAIRADGGKQAAMRAERHAVDDPGMPSE
jgi:hypothetical protein